MTKPGTRSPQDARGSRKLTPAAERALAEAAVRYGDWEVKGIASDFS